ncbi:MAG: divalent metal cation transporter [Nitrososphaerota archaeon]|nr:divalent metal cation transporter [Nitrososphaerota archaeon]
MIADVDAASIVTAAQDGASYGYGLVWFLLVLAIPLFLIQEAAGRIGIATGQGLGEVIRRHYTKRTAILMSIPMAGTDILSYIAEYAGIAIGFELLGVPVFLSLPVVYVLHISLVWKKRYVTVEKFLIAISAVFILSYVASLTIRGLPLIPLSSFTTFSTAPPFVYLLAASAGAVVMPFMLFYQASATAEKKSKFLWASRLETLVGAVVSEVIMVIILMATVGVNPDSFNISSVSTLTKGLSSVADGYSPILFAIGMIAAAFLALVVISLASAWAVTEAMGLGRNRFFWIYFVESLPALAVPMFFPNLFSLLLNSMVAFTFVLIGPGIILGLIAGNRKIMGTNASSMRLKFGYWLSLSLVVSFGIFAVLALF